MTPEQEAALGKAMFKLEFARGHRGKAPVIIDKAAPRRRLTLDSVMAEVRTGATRADIAKSHGVTETTVGCWLARHGTNMGKLREAAKCEQR